MKKFWADFKKFISRGSIIDLAVAVVIGAAFGKIITSLVDNIIMPLLTAIIGKNSIADLVFYVGSSKTPVAYGIFFQSIIDFLIIAICIFIVIKIIMKAQKGFGTIKTKTIKALKKLRKPILKSNFKINKGIASLSLTMTRKEVSFAKPTTEELLTEILNELKKQGK